MNKELIKENIRQIKMAVVSMECSSKHPKTSAHYRGIINRCENILKELRKDCND